MKIVALLLGLFVAMPAVAQQTISLAGAWTVRLDENKIGEAQQWYNQQFEGKIQLPGTLDDAGIGNPPTLTADSLTREVLLRLTRKHSYIGHAWYAREITIPAQWKGRQIELLLERVIWNTKVWIDGKAVGGDESLSAPHRLDVTNLLQPGKHLLVLRIDNSKQYDMSIRDMAHAYTNETQIMWNGVIGQLQLIARQPQYVSQVQVFPSVKEKSVKASVVLKNAAPKVVSATVLVQVLDRQKKVIAAKKESLPLRPGESNHTVQVAVPGAKEWDEFNPAVYTLRTTLLINGKQQEVHATSFGMREVTSANGLLYINGRRLFLRGTLECSIFPLTGHPPMERQGWLKVFTTARAYGLNHLRFHSWCPPRAAFEVADSLGMYLQVELPFWNKNAGKDTALNRFLENEATRILAEYGNHPSFCFLSMGNELEGDFDWLSSMVVRLKAEDPRRLYTTTTFTFQRNHGRWPEPADQFFITQYTKKGWVRGQGIFNTYPPDFKTDYTKAVDSIPAPIVTHEIGQYSVYPNMNEIAKYTGVLDPLNFKAIQKDLQRKNMLALSPAFTAASGKFAARLYKEEIERALKTKGVSGFQLLDLHDFPGQGTALVGILDAFWDSKGLVTAEEHRAYCAPVVPLVRFEKPTYTNDEVFTAEAEIANFSNSVLKDVQPVWTIKDATGKVLASGRLAKQTVGIGNGHTLGTISFAPSQITQATALTLELALDGTSYKNSWDIWVYPKEIPVNTSAIVFTSSLSDALQALQQGKKVLLNPDTASLKGVEGRFAPVFWSPVHFPDQPGTMGLLCDPQHAALKNFPTESHSNWQWWDIVTSSKTMIIDSLPAIDPLVRVMDNFFKNRKMAMVIEAKVGKGKLVLVSSNIRNNLDKRPAARQLRYSLEQYMGSEQFQPVVELTEEQLKRLFK